MSWRSQIAAVMFDLGGTLFKHLPAAATALNLRGVLEPHVQAALSDAQIERFLSLRRSTEQQFADKTFFLHKDLVTASFSAFASQLQGLAADPAQLAQSFYVAQRASVTQQLALRPDTAQVLTQLQHAGLQLSIVSNIDQDYLEPLLARTPEFGCMHFVLSSEQARSCKPAAGIYQQALANSGIAPEQVLFVGDSLLNDVRGPQAAGMRGCWLLADQPVQPRGEDDSCGADLVVRALSELVGELCE